MARETPTRVVWALAWPAVLLNSMQVVNTLLDRAFIGHLPLESLTAHGGATNVMFLMFSLAMALGTAATALVSRAFGAANPAEYRRASRQSLSLAVIGGLAIAGVTVLLAGPAARGILPAADREAIRLMAAFLAVYATCLPAIYVIQVLAGCLRGVGDTKSPMVISGLQILLHIALNFVMIFPTRRLHVAGDEIGILIPGMGLGLIGAGLALSASAWASAFIYLLYCGRTPLGAAYRIRLPSGEWTSRILRIAMPAAAMAVLRVGSLTAFTLVLKVVPNASVAIAAMTLGFAIESIMFMPSFGLSMAAGALVGQSLGMRRSDRAERLAWVASHHAALVTVLLAGPIFMAAPGIAAMLVGDKPALIHETAVFIRWLCVTEIGFAYAMVTIGAMQGAGDTVRPMWISIACLWGLRVPMAYLLAITLGMGALGAWIAMSFTQGVQGLLSVLLFKRGAWKTKQV